MGGVGDEAPLRRDRTGQRSEHLARDQPAAAGGEHDDRDHGEGVLRREAEFPNHGLEPRARSGALKPGGTWAHGAIRSRLLDPLALLAPLWP